MRKLGILLLLLSGCSSEANHLGNPLLWPFYAVSTGLENSVYNERRGRVEVLVKTNYDQILEDIRSGGGAALTEAMDAALIPVQDRPTRIMQLQADLPLHESSPDALVVSLMVYGP